MTPLRLVTAAVLSCAFVAGTSAAATAPGRATSDTGALAERTPFVGLVRTSTNAPAILARLNPLSLKPVSRGVKISEYHDAWSLSPDGSFLALAVSAGESQLSPSRRLHRRIGIYIVDIKTMELVREVETGVAAEALAWLAPNRLVAALQRGGTVLVDPLTGNIMRRWPQFSLSGFSFPDSSAQIGGALVMLLPQLRESAPNMPLTPVSGAPRLAAVTPQGHLRSVTLSRIRLAVRSNGGIYTDRAALAVDPKQKRAYVFAANAPAAEVDLRTMHVTYHSLGFLSRSSPSLSGSGRKSTVLARVRSAIWLGQGRAVVFGYDLATEPGRAAKAFPAGATIVNTGTWRTQLVDPRASDATVAHDTLLVHSRESSSAADVGLSAYTLTGRSRYRLLRRARIEDVRAAAGLAYVRSPSAVYVLDISTAKLIEKIAPSRDLLDVISQST
jgi:hypothetical protein